LILTYKCTNENCENYGEFDVDIPMKDIPLLTCEKCHQDVTRVYKTANVNLNFKDSYNSTRK
jgi:predicted nucleic acid-binding Zn ribbon protein